MLNIICDFQILDQMICPIKYAQKRVFIRSDRRKYDSTHIKISRYVKVLLIQMIEISQILEPRKVVKLNRSCDLVWIKFCTCPAFKKTPLDA